MRIARENWQRAGKENSSEQGSNRREGRPQSPERGGRHRRRPNTYHSLPTAT